MKPITYLQSSYFKNLNLFLGVYFQDLGSNFSSS